MHIPLYTIVYRMPLEIGQHVLSILRGVIYPTHLKHLETTRNSSNKSKKNDRSSMIVPFEKFYFEVSRLQWIHQQKLRDDYPSPTFFPALSPGRHRLARGGSLRRERSRRHGAGEILHRCRAAGELGELGELDPQKA